MDQITQSPQTYQITTAVSEIYDELVNKQKLFPAMYHLFAFGLVYGILQKKKHEKSRSRDLIRVNQIGDETIRDVIDICYNILKNSKSERDILNEMLSYADGGIVELNKIYEKNGSFMLPILFEDSKKLWNERLKDLHNINLENLKIK